MISDRDQKEEENVTNKLIPKIIVQCDFLK